MLFRERLNLIAGKNALFRSLIFQIVVILGARLSEVVNIYSG